MVVVRTKNFRVNKTKYINKAKSIQELKNALIEVREYMDGKRTLLSAEELANEL